MADRILLSLLSFSQEHTFSYFVLVVSTIAFVQFTTGSVRRVDN